MLPALLLLSLPCTYMDVIELKILFPQCLPFIQSRKSSERRRATGLLLHLLRKTEGVTRVCFVERETAGWFCNSVQ